MTVSADAGYAELAPGSVEIDQDCGWARLRATALGDCGFGWSCFTDQRGSPAMSGAWVGTWLRAKLADGCGDLTIAVRCEP